MEVKYGSQEFVDFVTKRNIDEIKALSKEHKIIFTKMPFVFEGLSTQACKLLTKMAMYQKTTDITDLNKESLFICHAEQMLDTLKYQRHILHLSQLIRDRERQNARDREVLDKFKEELKLKKHDLEKAPSSEENQKEITSFKGKAKNYEHFLSNTKKPDIKSDIMPESIKLSIDELESLQHERHKLKMMSDNITLVKSSKKDLLKLQSARKHL